MSAGEAARYRAMVARCNFLGCDWPGAQYAAKEASRWMARPCQGDQGKNTGIGKYLNGGTRRLEQVFPYGEERGVICAYAESDLAGYLRIRESTSRGVLCIWGHIEQW